MMDLDAEVTRFRQAREVMKRPLALSGIAQLALQQRMEPARVAGVGEQVDVGDRPPAGRLAGEEPRTALERDHTDAMRRGDARDGGELPVYQHSVAERARGLFPQHEPHLLGYAVGQRRARQRVVELNGAPLEAEHAAPYVKRGGEGTTGVAR